ncbi:MAG: winged helix-turn-helix domain-containing protein [Bacilli bacterium]|jgi:DNA-binding response OmpR family regulator|nr:winged helix-turn-helix domain-containing protein [Bacilli bacterium]
MIKIACLNYNNQVINNFNHDNMLIDYYNDISLIAFDKYQVILILNDKNNVDINKVVTKVRKLFSGIIYLLDYQYQNDIINTVFKIGATDYFVYPIDNSYLVNKIMNQLNNDKKLLKEYHYQDLIFNFQNSMLMIDSKRIALTKIECAILNTLFTNVNNTVSRQELSHQVWGYDLDDYRTIETHIKTIRIKLGTYKKNLLTIWGTGYTFME